MTSIKTMAVVLAAAAGFTGTAHAADMLVTPQWLAAHGKDADLVILHVGDAGDYRSHHIAGARYVALEDIAVDSGGLSLQMPAAADLKARLEKLGISDRSRIVVYYGKDWVTPATRVVFTLYTAGLGDHVSLLDGGLKAWQHAGLPVTRDVPAASTGSLSPLEIRPVIVDQAFVRAHVTAPGYDIVDARAQVFYDGLLPGGPMSHHRNGHIPGAHSIPFSSLTRDDLTQKSPDEVRTIFAAAGIKPGDHVIAYCHIGQQATEVLFAAREIGVDAVLYDGSFEDWAIAGLPVETKWGH